MAGIEYAKYLSTLMQKSKQFIVIGHNNNAKARDIALGIDSEDGSDRITATCSVCGTQLVVHFSEDAGEFKHSS